MSERGEVGCPSCIARLKRHYASSKQHKVSTRRRLRMIFIRHLTIYPYLQSLKKHDYEIFSNLFR